MLALDTSQQVAIIQVFWEYVLSGLSTIYSAVHSSVLLQLIFLLGLIETGAVIVKVFKKEDDSEK